MARGGPRLAVVAVAESVHQRLAQGLRRVLGPVLPAHPSGDDPARDREVHFEERVGLPQEREGVALKLAVVDELGLCDPAEPGGVPFVVEG